MASKTCASCLWVIQRQSRSISKITKLNGRAFTTTSTCYAEVPDTKATVASSGQSVSPNPAASLSQATPSSPKIKIPLVNKFTTYTAYGITETMYHECGSKADYTMPKVAEDAETPKTAEGEDLGLGDSWWHTEVGLKPTFSTWSQVTMLHMYLLSARLRCFPKAEAQTWQQHLLDHYFHDAEEKMAANHNMHARGTRNKYLKDLYIQWRGLLAAYDEGVQKGDAVLAAAIWRNVFKASEETDIRRLAQIVSFMRRSLQSLDMLPDDRLGRVKFGSPQDEVNVVRLKSPMMDLHFQKVHGTNHPGRK